MDTTAAGVAAVTLLSAASVEVFASASFLGAAGWRIATLVRCIAVPMFGKIWKLCKLDVNIVLRTCNCVCANLVAFSSRALVSHQYALSSASQTNLCGGVHSKLRCRVSQWPFVKTFRCYLCPDLLENTLFELASCEYIRASFAEQSLRLWLRNLEL